MKKHHRLMNLAVIVGVTLSGILTAAVMEKNGSVYENPVILCDAVFDDEMIPLSEGAAALPVSAGDVGTAVSGMDASGSAEGILEAQAVGVLVKQGNNAVIDYSNTKDGYVMVQYGADSSKRLKVQVKGPTATYTYNLPVKQWNVFPLSDGNGAYQVSVFQNVSDNRYAQLLTSAFNVELADEFSPFIRPNQYVNYSAQSLIVATAAELTKKIEDPLKKVEVIYDYVVENLTYDKEKARTVVSGYLPVLDQVLEEKKGICFDYAALMTGMLRSQQIPCKLVVGYAGNAYHAWISVWTQETGWIDGVIYFDSSTWHRMDPTFASSANRSDSIMKFIGDGNNYTTKYLY